MSVPARVPHLVVSAILLVGCFEEPFPTFAEETELRLLLNPGAPAPDTTNEVLSHPDQDVRQTARELGAELFEDAALSGCGFVSCRTRHEPEQGFTYNGGPGGPACDGTTTGRNPPSLYNVAHSDWFMWDGRADRLWSQAVLPYLSPNEMAGDPSTLRQRLNEPVYAERYEAVFGVSAEAQTDEEVLASFGKLLQAYEWTLTRAPGAFDAQLSEYLELVKQEDGSHERHPLHLGLKVYARKGQCLVCHKGALLTDQTFHNIGVADDSAGRRGRLDGIPVVLESVFNAKGPYSANPSGPTAYAANRLVNLSNNFQNPSERERLEGLGQLEGAFKTPSLRNLTRTAPYMHTGALETLEAVVDFYDRGGDPAGSFAGTRAQTVNPLSLTAEERAALLSLLELLSED